MARLTRWQAFREILGFGRGWIIAAEALLGALDTMVPRLCRDPLDCWSEPVIEPTHWVWIIGISLVVLVMEGAYRAILKREEQLAILRRDDELSAVLEEKANALGDLIESSEQLSANFHADLLRLWILGVVRDVQLRKPEFSEQFARDVVPWSEAESSLPPAELLRLGKKYVAGVKFIARQVFTQ